MGFIHIVILPVFLMLIHESELSSECSDRLLTSTCQLLKERGQCKTGEACEKTCNYCNSDSSLCKFINEEQCHEQEIHSQCPNKCKEDATHCKFITNDGCKDELILNQCPKKCRKSAMGVNSQRPAFIPSENECGLALRNFVVGGKLTSAGDWPWLAAIVERIDGKIFCGGTLITNQYVISAASCFSHSLSDNATVRLGEYDINIYGDGAQDYDIVDRRVGSYDRETKENDIILLKLDRPVSSFTDIIRPACLPYHLRNDPLEGKTLRVVGWGIFDQSLGPSPSQVPLEGDVSVVPLQECQRVYENRSYKVLDKHLCAGTGGTDACNGDGGAPLNYADLRTGRFYVVGLNSFGPKLCGSASHPSVYTRIGYYLDWIEENIRQMSIPGALGESCTRDSDCSSSNCCVGVCTKDWCRR